MKWDNVHVLGISWQIMVLKKNKLNTEYSDMKWTKMMRLKVENKIVQMNVTRQ